MGRWRETVEGVKGYNGCSDKLIKGWFEDFFVSCDFVVNIRTLPGSAKACHAAFASKPDYLVRFNPPLSFFSLVALV